MANILLTGFPGVGKTTAIKRIVEGIDYNCTGFLTEEIRDLYQHRIGFKVVSLDKKREGTLAHVNIRSDKIVGKYCVLIDEFEEIAIEEMSKKSEIIVVDEIGKMELFSEKFKELLLKCLDKGNVLASITMRGGGEFVWKIKEREDIRIIQLTEMNRNKVIERLISELNEKKKEERKYEKD